MNLEQLFKNAFEDESVQSTFYYEMLHQPLYVLGEANDFDGVLEDGNELKLVSLKHEGMDYIPVFLSEEAMQLFVEQNKTPFLKMSGQDLLETLKHSNIVINPGQSESIVLYAEEIAHILSQGKN